MHVRTRSSHLAAAGGICDRSRLGTSGDAQSAPASPESPVSRRGSAATSGFVSGRRRARRRTTVVQRTGVRFATHAGQDVSVIAPASPTPYLIRAVQWYQQAFSGRPSPCRFSPSCSCYAVEALEVHGNWKGLRLTIRRLARCRPFGPSGFDPVPEPTPASSHHLAPRRASLTPRSAHEPTFPQKGL